MANEELLKLRYISTIVDPYCTFGIGDIFETETVINSYKEYQKLSIDFPRAFKILQWWELRKINDLPEYLKSEGWESLLTTGAGMFKNITKRLVPVYKVKEYYTNGFTAFNVEKLKYFETEKSMPATKEEYDNYIKHFVV